jgi:tubulin-specific chaperone A
MSVAQQAAIEETKAIFTPLRQRISNALQKLEDHVKSAEQGGASDEEIAKAKEVVEQAKKAAKSEN